MLKATLYVSQSVKGALPDLFVNTFFQKFTDNSYCSIGAARLLNAGLTRFFSPASAKPGQAP